MFEQIRRCSPFAALAIFGTCVLAGYALTVAANDMASPVQFSGKLYRAEYDACFNSYWADKSGLTLSDIRERKTYCNKFALEATNATNEGEGK